MIIAPSLLSANFLHLDADLKNLNSIPNLWIHLDVMDNHFVPNLTFGKTVLANLHTVSKHPLDAHFMVENPETYIETYSDIKLYNFTFHFEACKNSLEVIKKAKSFYPSVGISIKPGTPVSVLNHDILSLVDLILIMSVEPGFGGQSFMNNSLDKVKILHEMRINKNYKYKIEVDGGINDSNANSLEKLGADVLVAGNYVFKHKQGFEAAVKSMRTN